MSDINISDVKISFGGIELTPFFISQSLKDAKTTFSTLREELPKNLALMSFTASVKKE